MNILLDKLNNGDNIDNISDIMTSSYKDREGKFEKFWDEAANILEELCVPDERRQNNVLHKSNHEYLLDSQ